MAHATPARGGATAGRFGYPLATPPVIRWAGRVVDTARPATFASKPTECSEEISRPPGDIATHIPTSRAAPAVFFSSAKLGSWGE